MKKKITCSRSFLGACSLAAALLLGSSTIASAQEVYWSVFGNADCHTGGYTMDAQATSPNATSFSAIPEINDYHPSSASNGKFQMAHSVYSTTGQVLFSVNQHGIYAPSGVMIYDFTTGSWSTTVTVGGVSTTITPREAMSEVCTFPCTAAAGYAASYYAVCWALASGSGDRMALVAYKVNITASGDITVVPNVLYDQTSTGMVALPFNVDNSWSLVAADQGSSCTGGARDVYTLEPVTEPTGELVAALRKWHFPADGSLPSSTTATFFNKQYYHATSFQSKILQIGSQKYFSFIAGVEDPTSVSLLDGMSRFVAMWNISSTPSPGNYANVAKYDLGLHHEVHGFEHVQSGAADLIYVSFETFDPSTGNLVLSNSGLGWFTTVPVGSTNGTLNLTAGTSQFSTTDLALSAGGNLFMAQFDPNSFDGIHPPAGNLAYLASGAFGSSSATPVLLTSSCSSGSSPSNISVLSLRRQSSSIINNFSFYLGKQFIGLTANPLKITDVDINTICTPGAYGSMAPAPQYSVTVTGGSGSYTYDWSTGLSTFGPTADMAHLDNVYAAHPIVTWVGNTVHRSVVVTDAVTGCSVTKPVFTRFIQSGYELATRDSHFDMYTEPNNQALIDVNDWNFWKGPDIWNRYHADGVPDFEVPVYVPGVTPTPENHLYVKVRNVGCANYTGDKLLHTYWTMGGGSETWPSYWDATNLFTACDGTSYPIGFEITGATGGVSIPPIPAGGSAILEMPWTPPNPYDYLPSSCHPVEDLMLCFLSRIVDDHNPATADGMTFEEATTGDITPNIEYNNNIASYNSTVVTLNALPAHRHLVFVSNGLLVPYIFSIEIANGKVLELGTGVSTLSGYVTGKVYLGDDLYKIWESRGAKGVYLSTDRQERSVTFDCSHTLRLDNIYLGAGAKYPVDVEFQLNDGADGSSMPREAVHFRQLLSKPKTRIVITPITYARIDTTATINVDSTYDSLSHGYVFDTAYQYYYDTTYVSGNDTLTALDSVCGNYTFNLKYEPVPPACPGVLAVTEVSTGPSAISSGCSYGEILVAGCGTCNSPTVDVRGWIIDDNSGNFNLYGCSVEAGITQSHYRLSYDNTWSNVPVGSIIVVYNADSNCYNLPDSFAMTAGNTFNLTPEGNYAPANVYWVPLGSVSAAPMGTPHIERFRYLLDSPICTYVVDTTTDSASEKRYYQAGKDWENTINLDPAGDAFQVRCPRCDHNIGNSPSFYHGIGYGADSGSGQFAGIAASGTCAGGAVIFGVGGGYKYTFAGSEASQLGDATYWKKDVADQAGSIPHTLGNINNALADALFYGTLQLPCCLSSGAAYRKANHNPSSPGSSTTAIKSVADRANGKPEWVIVYPVPATTQLHFEYSRQDMVTIKLMDMAGRTMQEQTLANNTGATIDVGSYPPGVYLYQVISGTIVQSGKVVVGK